MARLTRFGFPLPPSRSEATVILVDLGGGVRDDVAPTNLPLGATPGAQINEFSQNFVYRDGGIQLRPTLSSHTSNANPLGTLVTGGAQIKSSVGSSYQLASGTTRFAYYSTGSWSPLSYVSAFGNSAPPSITTYERVKMVQVYEPRVDEMIAVASVTSSYQTLFSWQAGATVFSGLTSAPKARWVDTVDNFLIAGNVRDSSGSKYIQRIQWSDRGNPSNWTAGLSGFEDLLDARGGISQIKAQGSRVIVFFEHEIWYGVRDAFPNTFRFYPLDRSVGTRFGHTVAETPKGLMFLGSDYMVYLLPKEGGTAVPVGQAVHGRLRDSTLADTTTAVPWAVYDVYTASYQLYYPVIDQYVADVALFMDINTGSWWYQEFGTYQGASTVDSRWLSIGWPGEHVALTGGGETWSSLSGLYTWDTVPFTWQQYLGTEGVATPTTFVGLSSGTIAYYRDQPGAATDTVGPNTANVEGLWRSKALGGENPERVKTVTAIRIDHACQFSSVMAVRFSSMNDHALLGQTSQLTLPAANVQPQLTAVGFPYAASRYPIFELALARGQARLYRVWVSMRLGGRSNA